MAIIQEFLCNNCNKKTVGVYSYSKENYCNDCEMKTKKQKEKDNINRIQKATGCNLKFARYLYKLEEKINSKANRMTFDT